MASASPLLYLPDGCWECIFKLLIDTNDDDFKDYNHVLKSLSVISKKFLSITSGLRFSLTVSENASLSFFCRDCQSFTNLNFELPKLEVLNLSHTRVDDETLYAISKSCCGLLIVGKGVMDVVKNCTQLTEVNLRHCYNMHADVVDSMISSRPSLRKIITPPWYNLKRDFVLPSTLKLL